MAKKIIQCIPNLSEGKNKSVIDAVLNELEGVRIVDHHSDRDHNRTVITFLGEPQAVEEAAFQAIKKAAELIDMDKHIGEHPRIGAMDVVPFVPIQDVNVQDCVEIAERLGKRVGDELNIPVYLYEDAARKTERKNLENIRKGQYEVLKDEIKTDPARAPDFGPAILGKAGATVIGARAPLIAFNVYLNTDDVSTAKKIARTVRFSSGGLRFVKAMGVLVEGQAQVSMNLTNFSKTAIPQVVELIRREAARYGVSVQRSELVGLIPQKALVDSAVWYLQLDAFTDEQILEKKLETADDNVDTVFLDALASKAPTPGGGSAAAFTAAEAAALVSMVSRLTIGKKKYVEFEPEMKAIVAESEDLRSELTGLIQADADAFEGVMQAYKLPKDTQEEQKIRTASIQKATLQAARIPLKTCQLSLNVLKLAEKAAGKGNKNAITDAGSASMLALAAISSAGANVRINLQSLEDEDAKNELSGQLEKVETQARLIEKRIRKNLESRAQINLF